MPLNDEKTQYAEKCAIIDVGSSVVVQFALRVVWACRRMIARLYGKGRCGCANAGRI